MNKTIFHASCGLLLICLTVLSCIACSNDDDSPVIDNVWRNMSAEPIASVDYAYPGQTLCLRGSGLGGLQKVIVNDTEIDVKNTLIYDTSESITFQLPADVNVSTPECCYIKVVTAGGEATFQPFYVKDSSEKPAITGFSSTLLVAGSKLTINGRNLDGVTEVYLPATYGQQVMCQIDEETESTETAIYVIVPDNTTFARGQVEVAMEKTNSLTGNTYTEKVYSATTNFSN